MSKPRRVQGFSGLQQAFDEVRFGPTRTLNLRASFPSAGEAATRVESWLRQHQMQRSGEVLVITGRGNNSEDGISVVREASIRTFHALEKKGVIAGFAEHTAGSFVVTFAPVRALFDAPNRRREKSERVKPPSPASLSALDPETLRQLRDLSTLVLAVLGVHSPTRAMIEDEMRRQFAALSAALPDDGDREALLQQAMVRALEEYERDK